MSADKIIQVIIADDHEFFRDGLATVLALRSDLNIVAHAANGKSLIEKVETFLPDLVITDITMPIIDGIEATRIINKRFPQTKVIALSMHNDDLIIQNMMKAGAMGFADKAIKRDDLFFAIDQVVYHNARYLTEGIEQKLLKNPGAANDTSNDSGEAVFTERELQIIYLLIEEKTIKEMADILDLSIKTIESHRARIMKRMNVRSMAGMVAFAFKHNMF